MGPLQPELVCEVLAVLVILLEGLGRATGDAPPGLVDRATRARTSITFVTE